MQRSTSVMSSCSWSSTCCCLGGRHLFCVLCGEGEKSKTCVRRHICKGSLCASLRRKLFPGSRTNPCLACCVFFPNDSKATEGNYVWSHVTSDQDDLLPPVPPPSPLTYLRHRPPCEKLYISWTKPCTDSSQAKSMGAATPFLNSSSSPSCLSQE